MTSLHDTLLFYPCRNYSDDNDRIEIRDTATPVPEMVDNDYTTYSSEDDVDVDMSDDGNATRVDAVFIKSKNVDTYVGTPTGGTGSGWTSRSIPDTVENYEGADIDTEIHGFQHDLYLLPTHFTATSVRLEFTGTDIEIYEVMLLEIGFEVDANVSYQDMDFNRVDRAGSVPENQSGAGQRVSVLGAERQKWEYACGVYLKRVKMKELLHWMENNPNFVAVMEFSRHPERVFPAFWGALEVSGRYFTVVKGNGNLIQFVVSEI